jgi:hypothetical protein
VNEESQIMSTSEKTNCCDERGKSLKLSSRSLLKTIKEVTKVTNHTIESYHNHDLTPT